LASRLCCQVVEENKRQLCVFKLLEDNKKADKWWDYVAGFTKECTMANGRFADRSCIRAQLEKVSLQESDVDSCMGDSTSDTTHDLLEVGPLLFPKARRTQCCLVGCIDFCWQARICLSSARER